MKKSIPTIGTDAARPSNNAPHVMKAIAALDNTDIVQVNAKVPGAIYRAFKAKVGLERRTNQEVILELMTEYLK